MTKSQRKAELDAINPFKSFEIDIKDLSQSPDHRNTKSSKNHLIGSQRDLDIHQLGS